MRGRERHEGRGVRWKERQREGKKERKRERKKRERSAGVKRDFSSLTVQCAEPRESRGSLCGEGTIRGQGPPNAKHVHCCASFKKEEDRKKKRQGGRVVVGG